MKSLSLKIDVISNGKVVAKNTNDVNSHSNLGLTTP